jgi:flagellar P-ring protein precursor FlgI
MRLLYIIILLAISNSVLADRIKDLTSVAGVRTNQLLGYGLVVGLDGTGDQTSQTPFTVQSLKSFLNRYNITIPPNVNPQLKNVAAVSVHAEMPAFVKPGQTIDVTISSLGNSKSLRGGSLLMSPLKGIDNKVYAIAQGNLVVGGLGVQGSDGSSITINVPSVGRIPNGAIVERAIPSNFALQDHLYLNLHTSDFTTATRMQDRINEIMGGDVANALDPVTVRVRAPFDASNRVSFLSEIENIRMKPGEGSAKVIVNSRTGTVVIGSNVRVSPAAVSHGSLVVTISENMEVSQPNELSIVGNTEVTVDSDIDVQQNSDRMFLFSPGISLNSIVNAVNEVGAAPGDLVAILEALKQAGALKAELIVI